MNLALISQEYPPETARGGIGSQTYIKAQGLSGLGHKVFVISRSIDADRHEVMDGDICIIRIPGLENKMPEMTDIVQWITHSVVVAAEIEALDKRIGLDLIDFPEWAAEGYTYLLNRTSWKNIPTVIQLHGPLVMFGKIVGWPDMESEFYRVGTHMEATCVQLADAVYSSSECSTKWIRSYYNPQKQTIPTIHLGVDTLTFAPQQGPRNELPTIIFIGKIVRNKGVEELVEAACNIVKNFTGLRLRLIGRGEESLIEKLKQKANSLHAPDLLEFKSFINKENLPQELSRAHVFAAPSYYEGGPGFVYLEAMACGLPVIGCSGSGVDEIITSGDNGILVPPKDVKTLEEALRKILSDKKISRTMGIKGREFVLRNADSNDCLKKLEAFYKFVVETTAAKKKEVVEYD